ncbi:hypothetical protein ACFL6M_00470 [Candidatus Eisenbacteria bacterium]|uniref:L-2-amino-thiazoline-4-carboxylic acid hydrolase n=1 Tax=Eiseniibacteriota bacterium TaxID=2212470 RepID=A0ABV6YI90_UNCEI
MDEKAFRQFLAAREYTDEQTTAAIAAVNEFEGWLAARQQEFTTAPVADLKEYLAELVHEERNTRERLLDLARYCWVVRRNDFYIHFTKLFGGLSIFPSIAQRLEEVAGKDIKEAVFKGIEQPPLGSPPEAYPPLTELLMERMQEHLSPEQCRRVLAFNHHGIPVENFEKHKAWFAEAQSIDRFLERVHEEAISDLEEHAREGKIWYEQEITPEVIELVRSNQEILSAVRDGDRLYITKIPYAGKEYLEEKDPTLKRYHACHCPLAREAILMEDTDVPYEWCNCSAGFGKLMFDTVLEDDMQAEVLESALRGDPRCRFALKISPRAR